MLNEDSNKKFIPGSEFMIKELAPYKHLPAYCRTFMERRLSISGSNFSQIRQHYQEVPGDFEVVCHYETDEGIILYVTEMQHFTRAGTVPVPVMAIRVNDSAQLKMYKHALAKRCQDKQTAEYQAYMV